MIVNKIKRKLRSEPPVNAFPLAGTVRGFDVLHVADGQETITGDVQKQRFGLHWRGRWARAFDRAEDVEPVANLASGAADSGFCAIAGDDGWRGLAPP